jgi:LL-H family phage holin
MISEAITQLLPHLVEFLAVVVTCAVGLIAKTVHANLNAAKNNHQFFLLAQYAEIAVKAAEQSITSGNGKEKMEYAARFLANVAKTNGLGIISESMIATVLEAAVFAVKADAAEKLPISVASDSASEKSSSNNAVSSFTGTRKKIDLI